MMRLVQTGLVAAILLLCSSVQHCDSLEVLEPERLIFYHVVAMYGPYSHFPGVAYNVTGEVAVALPRDACKPLANADQVEGKVVLVRRGTCNFILKTRMIQQAGGIAAVVANYDDTDFGMKIDEDMDDGDVEIYTFGILKSQESLLDTLIARGKPVVVAANPNSQRFVMLVQWELVSTMFYLALGVTVSWIFISAVTKAMRVCERRRRPLLGGDLQLFTRVQSATTSDETEICAICQDDYKAGDSLRVLPCDHRYHQECVDPWLLEKSLRCPMCNQTIDTVNPGAVSRYRLFRFRLRAFLLRQEEEPMLNSQV